MRFIAPIAAGLLLISPFVIAQITPEEISVETMPERGENWFIGKTGNGGYIFDATNGEMQGMISLSRYTPAVTFWPSLTESIESGTK